MNPVESFCSFLPHSSSVTLANECAIRKTYHTEDNQEKLLLAHNLLSGLKKTGFRVEAFENSLLVRYRNVHAVAQNCYRHNNWR